MENQKIDSIELIDWAFIGTGMLQLMFGAHIVHCTAAYCIGCGDYKSQQPH